MDDFPSAKKDYKNLGPKAARLTKNLTSQKDADPWTTNQATAYNNDEVVIG